MLYGNQFEYVDPMGVLETAEKKQAYEPSGNDVNTVREMIKEEEFLRHCKQLHGQRLFLKEKLRFSEKRIIDELWKKLQFK